MKMKCTRCGQVHIVKAGFKKLAEGKIQRYKCQDCNKFFTGLEKFHHINEEEVNLIKTMSESHCKQREIARELGVQLHTIQYHL